MAKYKEYSQKQNFFIPVNLDINFPEGSYVRFLNDFFEKHIDTGPFEAKRKNDETGAPAKHVKMMLKIIFYGFSKGIYSMRKISEYYLPNHLDFIYLAAMQTVDHSTLSRFLNFYSKEITKCFTEILYIANKTGYVSHKLIAIDGSKIKANASKRFTGNYKDFEKRKKVYEKMIGGLIDKSERLDRTKESEKYQKKINKQKTRYSGSLKRIEEFIKECDQGKADKEQKINLVDSDAKIMAKNKSYYPGYNSQIAVDDNGMIIAEAVTNISSDRNQAVAMVELSRENLKKIGLKDEEIKKTKFLMDKGYQSSSNIGELIRKEYDIYIPFIELKPINKSKTISSKHCKLSKTGKICTLECPGGQILQRDKPNETRSKFKYVFCAKYGICKECQHFKRCYSKNQKQKKFHVNSEVLDNLQEINTLKKKMKSIHSKDIYDHRFGMVEPVFGIITEQRFFKNFLVRGLEKVKTHWNLATSAFNLRRLHKLQYQA